MLSGQKLDSGRALGPSGGFPDPLHPLSPLPFFAEILRMRTMKPSQQMINVR